MKRLFWAVLAAGVLFLGGYAYDRFWRAPSEEELARLPWIDRSVLDCEQLPFPVKLIGEQLPEPTKAPTVGEHTDAVLERLLGYDAAKISELRSTNVVG